MTFQMTFLELVGLVLTLLGGFWGLAKMLISANSQRLDERFNGVHEHLKTMQNSQTRESEKMHRIERDLLELRAELPEKYALREDLMRSVGEVRIAIDALSLRFENFFLRGKHAE